MIDNRMTFKIDVSKTFPEKTIVKLGLGAGIKHPNLIIEETEDLLKDFIG